MSEPILAAVRTNPHLRLIVVDPFAKQNTTGGNSYWQGVHALAKAGEDVWLVNADFESFSEMIPDLKALTPAQQLTRDIKKVAGN